jgi:hypothetical protein
MQRSLTLLTVFCFAAMLPSAAYTGVPKIYKWTDSQGVLHYSDKPPTDATPGVQLLDLPELPPVDPEKIAETQAWIASVNAMQQHQKTEAELDQHQRELAQQQAQLDATLAALQQYTAATAQSEPVYLAYAPTHSLQRHREPDRDDFKPAPQPKPRASGVPTWPFPYNLPASSFPEERHKP